jgi:hypothetical protein
MDDKNGVRTDAEKENKNEDKKTRIKSLKLRKLTKKIMNL